MVFFQKEKMMDLSKFEKISGREALRRLADGEKVYTDEHEFIEPNHHERCEIRWFFMGEGEFYIPKPFDVRQAMRDRPNEWVGAFKPAVGSWMKVGFNELCFTVEVRPLIEDGNYLPSHGSNGGYGATESQLNKCVPIEDVPNNVAK